MGGLKVSSAKVLGNDWKVMISFKEDIVMSLRLEIHGTNATAGTWISNARYGNILQMIYETQLSYIATVKDESTSLLSIAMLLKYPFLKEVN